MSISVIGGLVMAGVTLLVLCWAIIGTVRDAARDVARERRRIAASRPNALQEYRDFKRDRNRRDAERWAQDFALTAAYTPPAGAVPTKEGTFLMQRADGTTFLYDPSKPWIPPERRSHPQPSRENKI